MALSKILASCLGAALLGTVASQFLLDVAIHLILFLGLYQVLQKKDTSALRAVFPVGIEWALVGYFLVAVVSIAVNAPPPKPWWFSLKKFFWIPHLYILAWAAVQVRWDLKNLMRYFNWVFLLPNAYAIYGHWIGVDPITGINATRAVGLVHSAGYHAYANAPVFTFFFALFLQIRRQLNRRELLFSLFALILMWFSIYFTYTRGAWIATLAGLLVALALQGWRPLVFGGLGALASGVVAFFLSTRFQERVLFFFKGNESDTLRANLLKVHWEMFSDHPILGIGYWDQYRRIAEYWPRLGLPSDHFSSHAHNQILNVMATTGLLGLFFYLALVGYFIWLNLKSLKRSGDGVSVGQALLKCLLVAQVTFHVLSLTDVMFEYAKIRAVLLIVWAVLLKAVLLKDHKTTSRV